MNMQVVDIKLLSYTWHFTTLQYKLYVLTAKLQSEKKVIKSKGLNFAFNIPTL